jgi:SAM-dependent methyltransferase
MTFGKSYVDLYDRFYANKDYAKEFENLQIALERRGKLLKGKRLLEIGSGSGNFTNLFAQIAEVSGVDINEDMIERAKLKFPELSSNLRCLTIKELINKYDRDSFDVIVLLFHVFSYLSPNEIILLKELTKKIITSGGILIFDYWDLDAVDMNRPSTTQKKINFDGRNFLRIAETQSLSRNDKSEEFEVKFDFFLEESQKQNLLFTEKHLMRSYFSRDLDIQFKHLECVENWDIVEGEPFQRKNYGNTKILVKP